MLASGLDDHGPAFCRVPIGVFPEVKNGSWPIETIGFPIDELLREEECYKYPKRSLHPGAFLPEWTRPAG
jgi:hypothetical protein